MCKQEPTFASMYIWQIFPAQDIELVHEMKLKNSSSQITWSYRHYLIKDFYFDSLFL